MKKKRRILVSIGIAVTVFVGALFILATREHPDYVRAAKLLPEMRQKARDAFGPLTWEEFREESGIVILDDADEWGRIQGAIPRDLNDFLYLDPPEPQRFGEMFETHKAWFLSLPGQLDRLVIILNYARPVTEFITPAKNLLNIISIGIIGAADIGDTDSVRLLTETGFSIVGKYRVEFDSLRSALMLSGCSVLNRALLTAVAKYPTNKSLVSIAREFLEGPPKLGSLKEAFAGDARTNLMYFGYLHHTEFFSLNYQLDHISEETSGSSTGAPLNPTFGDRVREFLAGISGENKNPRRTGEHTYDALEARLWEVQLDDFALNTKMLAERPVKLEQHDEFLDVVQGKEDLSYEYAKVAVFPQAHLSFVQYELLQDLSMLALMIVELYPSETSLPGALPKEMLPEDPFSTDKVLYRKTTTGFIVYSVYTNGTDDGYPLHDSDRYLLKNADIARSSSGPDFGIVLNYELPERAPVR